MQSYCDEWIGKRKKLVFVERPDAKRCSKITFLFFFFCSKGKTYLDHLKQLKFLQSDRCCQKDRIRTAMIISSINAHTTIRQSAASCQGTSVVGVIGKRLIAKTHSWWSRRSRTYILTKHIQFYLGWRFLWWLSPSGLWKKKYCKRIVSNPKGRSTVRSTTCQILIYL